MSRLNIGISVPEGGGGEDPLDAIQHASAMGAALARMAHDYPDQMLARIKTDHGDGTYTCDRPGTDILMKRVPSNDPKLAEQLAVGMTVVIKFYDRDRKKPYIWRIAGLSVAPFSPPLWSRITGDERGSFAAGHIVQEFGVIDVEESSPSVLIAARGGALALDWAPSPILLGISDRLIILTGHADTVHADYNPPLGIVYAYELDGSLVWSSDPGDGETMLPYEAGDDLDYQFHFRDGHRLQFDDVNNVVVVGSSIRMEGGSNRNKKVRFIGLNADNGAILWNDYIPGCVTAGMGIHQGILVKTGRDVWYWGTGVPRDLTTNTGATASDATVESHSWTAYRLARSGPVKLWQINPLSLFSAADYPILYTSHRSQFMPTGHPVFFGSRVYTAISGKYGLPQCTSDGTYQATRDEAETIFENLPTVVFDRQFGLLHVGSGIDARTTVSSDSGRLEAKICGINLTTGTVEKTYSFPTLLPNDGDHHVIDEASFVISAPAGFFAAGSPLTSFWPYASQSQGTTGLLANHQLDQAAATPATAPSGDGLHPSGGIYFGPCVGSINNSYGSYGDPEGEIGEYDLTDGPISAAFGTNISTPAQLALTRLYPHYQYWPYSAGYHWEPTPLVHTQRKPTGPGTTTDGLVSWRSDESNAEYQAFTGEISYKTPQSPALTVDASGNIYGAWIQPYGIVSARCSKTGNIKASFYVSECTLPDNYKDGTVPPSLPSGYIGGSIDLTWFGIPRRFTMYRGFQASWDSNLNLRWSREVTTWLTDTENGSGLSLPHAGCTMRMLPSSAGVFVLRAEKVPGFSSLPIIYNTARFGGYTKAQCRVKSLWDGVVTVGDHEGNLWARLVLELLDSATGEVIWRRVLWDPTEHGITTPSCIPVFSLNLSDGAGPWVIGTFRHALATWGNSGDISNYFGRYLLSDVTHYVFSCDHRGNVKMREANDDDPQGHGIRFNRILDSHVLMGGKLYYSGWSGSRWEIEELG